MTWQPDDALYSAHNHPVGRSTLARVLQGTAHLRLQVRWLIIGALAVVVSATAGWLGSLAVDHHRRDQAAAQAVAAATSYVMTLCNVSAATADKDFTTLFDMSTAQFNNAHQDSAAGLRQMIIDKKVAAHGSISHFAVESVTTASVTVVEFVDQTLTNTDMPQPLAVHAQMRMTLDQIGSRWLVSDIKLQ